MLEKHAVVLTEKEKEAHDKAVSMAQQRRIEKVAQQRAEAQKQKENQNAEKEEG